MAIVDASIATAWFVDIATSESALPIRTHPDLTAPALMRVELTSSLLKYVRAKLLEPRVLHMAVHEVGALIDEWVPDEDILGMATEIAVDHRHKIYDCLYLALAVERRQALITADRRMAAIARKLSIETELIEPAL